MTTWTDMYRTTYLFLVLQLSDQFSVDIYPIGEPMKVIGLFSSCINFPNRTNISINAEKYSNAWSDYFSKHSDFGYLQDQHKDHYKVTYLQFDVCDIETLTNVTTNLLLDSEHNICDTINNHSGDIYFGQGSKLKNWKFRSKVIWIYSYLIKDLDKRLHDLLVNLEVGIQNLVNGVATFKNDLKHIKNYDIMEARHLLEFIRLLSFTSLTSIYFTRYGEDFAELYKQFNDINTLETFTKCFKSEQVANTKEMLEVLRRLESENDRSAIIIFGDIIQYNKFGKVLKENGIKLKDRFWLLVYRAVTPNSFESLIESGRVYMTHKSHKSHLPPKIPNYLQQPAYLCDAYQTWLFHYSFGFEKFDFSRFPELIYKDIGTLQTYIERDSLDVNTYMEIQYWKKKEGKCLHQGTCSPGQEQRVVFHTENETQWSISKGYACRRCIKGYFKSVHDNSVCLKCREDYVINQEQTKCFDPIQDMYITFYRKPGSITLIFTSVVTSLVAIITCIFFVKRKSPLVRACDSKLSLLYQVGSLVVLLATIALFSGKPSHTTCILRPTVCIVYSWNFSLVLIKSRKILSAFSAKTKLSRGNVKLDIVMQMFFSFVITLFAVLILSYLYVQDFPKAIVITDKSQLTRYYTCDNTHHINLLVAYLMILQLFCAVQAFRTRNIPNTFYNAMSIVYATFAGTLCFGILFPIYYSQTSPTSKILVQLIVLVVHTAIFVAMQYIPIVWTILFNPNKNNIGHVRSKLLMMNVRKAESKIQTVSQ